MRNIPRILPLVGVAVGGVLVLNALSGARALPDLVSGARAFAEDAAKPEKPAKKAAGGKSEDAAPTGDAKDAVAPGLPPSSLKLSAVCAPTAAELAKEAGLSPAELQVLQSLGVRRGQLDQREQQLDVQIALLAAAEAKLDAKVRALTGLKADIKTLLAQADTREQTEIDRLVKVFEAMKPKDAAPRMVLLDDAVRLPIAAKMKERSLSAILAVMSPPEAKRLTESLAKRFTAARTLAANANTQAQAPMEAAPPAQSAAADAAAPAKPKAAPKKPAQARRPPAKAAPAAAQAANVSPAAKAPPAAAPAAPAVPAASAAKAG